MTPTSTLTLIIRAIDVDPAPHLSNAVLYVFKANDKVACNRHQD
jgi:hypothetical protein